METIEKLKIIRILAHPPPIEKHSQARQRNIMNYEAALMLIFWLHKGHFWQVLRLSRKFSAKLGVGVFFCGYNPGDLSKSWDSLPQAW